MNKLQMAHEYAIALINSRSENMEFDKFINLCHNYADAMHLEDEKRKDKSLPEVLRDGFVIDWSSIEPEIDYVAMDADKRWHGYRNEPNLKLDENQWVLGDHDSDYSHLLLDGYQGDWKQSLRKRPE